MEEFKIKKIITPRGEKSIGQYINDISRYNVLSPEEEINLVKKMRLGDEEARDKLINSNLRFVFSVAKQYQYKGLSLGDLINEGNIGLIKAAEKFDETKGFKFISYAVWWIRQSILESLSEKGRLIRLPMNKIKDLINLNKIFLKLMQELEREPTCEELAEEFKIMSPKEIENIMNINQFPFSLDTPPPNMIEEDFTLKDKLLDNDQVEKEEVRANKDFLIKIIEEVLKLKFLTKKEKEIIRLYYGIGMEYSMTLLEISKKLKITGERVRQIKANAIRKIKDSTYGKLLRQYF